ncbi:MAG: DHH family phosphoesterase [Candidatus Actinomarina sp.]|tara:strand:- start:571 stop:1515 length:945 start_codon:yes stop_codon:yes gene_type:complete
MTNNISDYFNNGSVFITGHVNPDGDALGAAFSLKLFLDSKNILADVNFDITTKLPSNLNHLPYDLISENYQDNYDTAFVFDCGNSSRLGKFEKLVLGSTNIIVVDHHVDPSFGDVQIIDSHAASTTQVLFRQFKNENIEISKDMANCLLTGLITDTGRFQYSNTTSEVFNIASELLDAGANLSEISENIYGSIEFNALTLQSKVIERIVLKEEISFAHSIVFQNDYSDYQVEPEETDFLIDVVRLVKESNVALLLKEQKDGSFKGSLRSRGDVNVQKIASIFDGGGHIAASGFSSDESTEEILKKIEDEIRKFI